MSHLKKLQTLAFHHLAEQMLFVKNKMVLGLVLAYTIILEILMNFVDLSVLSILIAHQTKPVWETNAWIHVQAHVLNLLFAMLLTIRLLARVIMDTPETRIIIAILFHLHVS